jgi:hypothetical protein
MVIDHRLQQKGDTMSRDDGIKLIAIYHFITAGLCLLGALSTLFILIVPVAMSYAPPRDFAALVVIVGLMFVLLAGLALLYVITGVALWRRKEWARWATIVLAVLGLFNFPIGTVIGGLILWFLLREDVVAAFRHEE